MSRRQRVEPFVLVAILVCLISLFVYHYPQISNIFPSPPVDRGNRGLIVLATDKADRDLRLYVSQQVKSNAPTSGDTVELAFFLRDLEDGPANQTRANLRFTATFAGFGTSARDIRCSENETLELVEIQKLDAGTRKAVEIDLNATEMSALDFKKDSEYVAPAPLAFTGTLRQYSGSLLVDSANTRETPSNVMTCQIPSRSMWRSSGMSDTLLPPQINWVAREGYATFPHDVYLTSSLTVTRDKESVLAEAYPEPAVDPHSWKLHWESAKWSSYRYDGIGPISFTNPPIWIFQKRSEATSRGKTLFWFGISIGVFSTIVLRLLEITTSADKRHHALLAPGLHTRQTHSKLEGKWGRLLRQRRMVPRVRPRK